MLRLLASNNRTVCTDSRTAGEPLAIFADVASGPRQARLQRHWFQPAPLRPDVRPATAGELAGSEQVGGSRPLDALTPTTPPLPDMAQFTLDTAAHALLAAHRPAERVRVDAGWAPNLHPRGWLANQLNRDCWPRFTLTDVSHDARFGFVGVRAEHVATLYALTRQGGGWQLAGEWSRWLF